MSAVASAFIGGVVQDRENERADDRARDARPNFPTLIEPGVRRQINRTSDTSVSPFEGRRVARFTGDQNTAFGMTPGLVDTLSSQQGTVGAGFNRFASGDMIGQNPFLQQAIEGMRETAFRDLTRNQLPQIRNNAIMQGDLGGSRQGVAEGLAIADLNRDLLNREGSLRSQQVNFDQGNMLNALINQGQILSNQTAPQDLLFQTGALQQAQDQAVLDANRQEFEESQNLQFNRDAELLRILLGAPASTPQIPPTTSPLAAALGTGLAASQIFGGQQAAPTINIGGLGASDTNNPSTSFYSNPFFYG